MRKMVFGRKLSRSRKAREALIRSLIRAIVIYGQITTTRAKAKAIVGDIDKIVNLAKVNNVSNQRNLLSKLGNDSKTVKSLFTKVAPKFGQRKSGFIKITNLSQRRGDRAEMVRIEWSEKMAESEKVKAKSVKTKKLEKTKTKKK